MAISNQHCPARYNLDESWCKMLQDKIAKSVIVGYKLSSPSSSSLLPSLLAMELRGEGWERRGPPILWIVCLNFSMCMEEGGRPLFPCLCSPWVGCSGTRSPWGVTVTSRLLILSSLPSTFSYYLSSKSPSWYYYCFPLIPLEYSNPWYIPKC